MSKLPTRLPQPVAAEQQVNTARFIQELLDAIKTLEKEVANLKQRVTDLETP